MERKNARQKAAIEPVVANKSHHRLRNSLIAVATAATVIALTTAGTSVAQTRADATVRSQSAFYHALHIADIKASEGRISLTSASKLVASAQAVLNSSSGMTLDETARNTLATDIAADNKKVATGRHELLLPQQCRRLVPEHRRLEYRPLREGCQPSTFGPRRDFSVLSMHVAEL
jgi:hypothetical protein